MRAITGLFLLLFNAGLLESQTRRNYTVDLENRNPAVGSLLIVFTDQNPAGLPPGIVAFCSGVLIGDSVFLTAGHCVGPSLPELPPFAKAYVTLSPTARDQSTWIPVSSQVVNPTLPPCPPPGALLSSRTRCSGRRWAS